MAVSSAILEVRELRQAVSGITAVAGVSFSVPDGCASACWAPTAPARPPPSRSWRGFSATAGELRYPRRAARQPLSRGGRHSLQKTRLQDFLTVRQCIALFRGLYTTGLEVDEVIPPVRAREARRARCPRKLSGGQQQRCCSRSRWSTTRRAVPGLEPTTGSIPQARRNFWELMQSIKARRKTIILTTHYMEEAELLCDEIVINGPRPHQSTQGPPRRPVASSTSRKCCFELGRCQSFQRGCALTAALNIIDASDRVEISTHDLEATLRTLLEAKVPLTNLRIRPATSRTCFLELTGTELRPILIRRMLSYCTRATSNSLRRTSARWCSRCCCRSRW